MSHDDFETQVRLAMGERAELAPTVDLADAAISRARRIRRRRGAASAAAALVTAAIAVPVGIQLADSAHRTDSSTAAKQSTSTLIGPVKPVVVSIAGLDRGTDPSVPYIDGSQFISRGEAYDLQPVAGRVTDAAALDDGLLVFSQDPNELSGATTYTANGTASALPQAKSVTPPAVDQASGGTAAAWALRHADAKGRPSTDDTIVYARSIATEPSTVETSLHVRQVMGVAGGTVVFNALEGRREVVAIADLAGPGGQAHVVWDNLKTVTAISPTLDQAAGNLVTPQRGERHCTAMFDTASVDKASEEWVSCEWRPVEFSPDASRVLAVSPTDDGLGPRTIGVLDSRTGDLVREFTTRGVFGRATFENAGTVVFVVAVGDRASIVRCGVDGSQCELAADPAPVTPAEPDAVLKPYQLTAN